MTINIFNNTKTLFIVSKARVTLWAGLLLWLLSPTVSYSQIKIKTHKIFAIHSNESILEKYTKTKYNVHGEIIEHAEYTENEKGSPLLKQLKIIKYNVEGLYIGTMVYDQNNALVWSEDNTYDENDQLIKITRTSYKESPVVNYVNLSYDKYGNVALSKTFDQKNNQTREQKWNYTPTGELLSTIEWFYTYRNKKTVKQTISVDNQYNTRGQLTQSTRLFQDGKNRIKDIKLFKNNAITDWTKYKNGRLISQFTNNYTDTFASPQEYELDPPIPQQKIPLEYDDAKRDPLANIPHTPFTTITFKNNKYGLPTRRITRIQNQVSEVVYYTYNDSELLVSEKIHDKISHTVEEVQYEYDHFNNPTTKNIYQNELLTQQHLYSYEYYRLNKK